MSVTKTDYGTYTKTLVNAAGDSVEFEFQKLGAGAATDLLLDLASLCGEAIGGAGDALRGRDASERTMRALIGAFSSRIREDKAMAKGLIKRLSSDRVLAGGANINFDTYYQDDLALCFQVVAANIEVQYSDFFKAAGGLLGITKPAATSESLEA